MDTDYSNRFPRAMAVFLVLLAGFIPAGVGFIISSLILSMIGFAVLMLACALYWIYLM